jgi:hypothetical protein
MGYRSNVLLAVAVSSPQQADELMAVYAMHPSVQTFDLAKNWQRKTVGKLCTVLIFAEDHVKWYESYEDVQGYEHMLTLAKTFADERGMDASNADPNDFVVCWPFATVKIRIGEEDKDIEIEYDSNSGNMESFIYDTFGVRREIVNSL